MITLHVAQLYSLLSFLYEWLGMCVVTWEKVLFQNLVSMSALSISSYYYKSIDIISFHVPPLLSLCTARRLLLDGQCHIFIARYNGHLNS